MKKLEDIPKTDIFETPEGYFDRLPGMIQSRVAQRAAEQNRAFSYYALRYALPVVVVMAALIFWFRPQANTGTAENILASIDTSDLVSYLQDDEITLDEMLEQLTLDDVDATGIQDKVYPGDVSDGDLDTMLDEMTDIDPTSL